MTAPEVRVELVHNRDGIRDWRFVDRCPYCGARHSHGAGREDTDPREYLGHRAAHCITGPRQNRRAGVTDRRSLIHMVIGDVIQSVIGGCDRPRDRLI